MCVSIGICLMNECVNKYQAAGTILLCIKSVLEIINSCIIILLDEGVERLNENKIEGCLDGSAGIKNTV